jgi:hypothetical protein
MAFEELKAQIGLLLGAINTQPEDMHELYEEIHLKLNELRATGMALPADLLDLEQRLLAEFGGTPVAAQQGLAPQAKSRQKPKP